jgi:hypothetical protein
MPEYERTLRLPLLVPSRIANPGLVGTAFDYAFRFEVQRRNPGAEQAAWVAEAALIKLALMARFWSEVKGKKGQSSSRPSRSIARSLLEMVVEAKAVIAEAKAFVRRYTKARSLTAKQRRVLGHHAIRLARLDVIYRAGLLEGALDVPSVDEVAEVAELVAAIPRRLRTQGRILLNPTFGRFSALVNGADADLIADSTLIDIKTTKDAVVEKAMVRQLLGYMILARAARAAKQRLPKLDTIAIYFSRHAHLWECSIPSIVNNSSFDAVEEWFLAAAKAAKGSKPLPAPPPQRSGPMLTGRAPSVQEQNTEAAPHP